jgi:protein arginine kinase
MERHLISRDHANADRSRSVAVNAPESISIMINEEDHLRSQVFGPGLQVEATYAAAEAFDEAVIRSVPIAFSEQFGFLTSCPTNTGTGMRVSVMLHLPGLVWADEMEKAANTAQKIHLAVRGLYGEGSRATGDFYQVSNQVTLGRSEAQIVDDVAQAVQRFVVWERKVRQALFEGERRIQTVDKIYRALGTLRAARILTSEECLNSLSAVRLGVHQGMIPELSTNSLNQILLLSQPAHLQDLFQQKLAPHERDQRRASLVRKILGGDDDTGD